MGYDAPLDMDVWGQTSLPEINRVARAGTRVSTRPYVAAVITERHLWDILHR